MPPDCPKGRFADRAWYRRRWAPVVGHLGPITRALVLPHYSYISERRLNSDGGGTALENRRNAPAVGPRGRRLGTESVLSRGEGVSAVQRRLLLAHQPGGVGVDGPDQARRVPVRKDAYDDSCGGDQDE